MYSPTSTTPSVRRMIEKYGKMASYGTVISICRYLTEDEIETPEQKYVSAFVLWRAKKNNIHKCVQCRRLIPPQCLYQGFVVVDQSLGHQIDHLPIQLLVSAGVDIYRMIEPLHCANTECRQYWQPSFQSILCSATAPCNAWHITVDIK